MKLLVLGSKGQLGRCLNDQLKNTDYQIVYTSRDQIDIADFETTNKQISDIAPDVLINATAYTAVDKAEEDQYTAELINHFAAANIADICLELDCWLIHVSTDYVFDGKSKVPFQEDDKTNPQGVYGDSKLKGERAIQSSGCKHLIIRTAWLFSEYGNNFLKTMLRLGGESNELSIVGDQIGCPTYAQDIARTIVMILPNLNLQKEFTGVLHYCGDQPCSWYEFAQAIFEEAKLMGFVTPRLIQSIEASAYPTPAARPAYSVLDCYRIELNYGIAPSDWRLGIQSSLRNLGQKHN